MRRVAENIVFEDVQRRNFFAGDAYLHKGRLYVIATTERCRERFPKPASVALDVVDVDHEGRVLIASRWRRL